MPSALITGIAGQDGSYLAELLLERGYRVIGVVRPDSPGPYPRIQHLVRRIEIVRASISNTGEVRQLLERYRPREVYNLGARASSSQLFADPDLTAEINGLAVVRMLDAIRLVDPTMRFCQASSSEMYGNPTESPQNESTPFRPNNPYGVAKLFAHGMVEVYRKHFGSFACSAILFNHESPRRGPEFVTRKIAMGAARIKARLTHGLTLGNLDATRDWGYAADYVDAMWRMLQRDVADDYVVATGVSRSVREFCDVAFRYVGLNYRSHVQLDPLLQRTTETAARVGDPSRIRTMLDWRPTLSFEGLVRLMVDAEVEALAER